MTDITTIEVPVSTAPDIIEVVIPGAQGPQGVPGIDGTNGTDGVSAYEVALGNGFVGTEAEWLASLVGADGSPGAPGADGADGASAYEVAVANGFTGTEAEWLESLVGADGTTADGDTAATPDTLVLRDGSAGFAAGTITADKLVIPTTTPGSDPLQAYSYGIEIGSLRDAKTNFGISTSLNDIWSTKIVSLAGTGGVATVETNEPHELRAGQEFRLYLNDQALLSTISVGGSVATGEYNFTVGSVVSATEFTFAYFSGSGFTDTGGGVVYPRTTFLISGAAHSQLGTIQTGTDGYKQQPAVYSLAFLGDNDRQNVVWDIDARTDEFYGDTYDRTDAALIRARFDGVTTFSVQQDGAIVDGTIAAGQVTGLATVATSGAYSDLSGKPTLGTAAASATTDFAAASHTHTASQITDFATAVAAVSPPTSAGGSSGQVQFNSSGSFAGDSGFTYNATNKAVTLGGATVTSSAPVLDLAQTWNASGTTFTGLKFNVTNTASAAESLLFDIQVGGSSRIKGSYTGNLIARAFAGLSGRIEVNPNDNKLYMTSATTLSWSSGTGTDLYSTDLTLSRKAAASLRLGAADAASPVAQTLGVQSVVAGTTNTAGANFTIAGSQGTGTGVGGSIVFQVAPAGSTGTAQNALATALTIAADGAITASAAISAPAFLTTSSNIITESTTARTLSATDNGKVIYCTNASAITITCATSLGAGFSCVIIQGGTGQVTVAAGSATLVSYGSLYKTAGQYAAVNLVSPVADTLLLSGQAA